MPEFDEAHLDLRRRVARSVTCPACRADHVPEDVLVIGYRDGVWVVVVVCARCHRQGILFVRRPLPTPPEGVELTPDEWVRFQHLSAIDEREAWRLRAAIWALEGPFDENA